MMELILNNEIADTTGVDEIALNFAINDVGDIQGRDGDISYPFDLPMTNKNKRIFENSEIVISGTLIPYRKLSAVIKVKGIVVLTGSAMLLEASKVYRIIVLGGNSDCFNIIGRGRVFIGRNSCGRGRFRQQY